MKKSWIVIRCYLYLVLALIACMLLCSCKTKYIPVETIREVYINNTDTFIQHDTTKTEINTILREARPEDSAMIANLGIRLQNNERLLILMQNQLKEASKEKYIHKIDTFIKTDSVDIPYPVERTLSKWEQIKMDYGSFALGGTLIAVILLILQLVRWIRRRDE